MVILTFPPIFLYIKNVTSNSSGSALEKSELTSHVTTRGSEDSDQPLSQNCEQ